MAKARLNLNVVVPREAYLNMIDDSLITPSTRALRLNETYFKARAEREFGKKDYIVTEAKKNLNDKNSGVFFNPDWDETLSIEQLEQMVLKAVSIANTKLQNAKDFRQKAIDELGGMTTVSMKTARERVDSAIATGQLKDTLRSSGVKGNVSNAMMSIRQWVIFNTIAEAYTNEIDRRIKSDALVNQTIADGDLSKLEALLPKIKVTELKTKVQSTIDALKKAEAEAKAQAQAQADSEAKAKADEEARQKAIADARQKLASATTPEEKAQAQAELNALLNTGASALGGSKTLLYVGIGAVVLIGAFLMFRRSN